MFYILTRNKSIFIYLPNAGMHVSGIMQPLASIPPKHLISPEPQGVGHVTGQVGGGIGTKLN